MEKPQWTPEPAESFGVDFLNVRRPEIQDAMMEMGDFVIGRSGPEGDDAVYFEGKRSAGTEIRIVIKKGAEYKSPAEIEQLHNDQ